MTDRLEAFVRGVAFREPNLPVGDVVKILESAIEGGELHLRTNPDNRDRALLKIAALSVAFWREVRNVVDGKFELDHRDEAILDAVLEHLTGGGT